MMVEEGVATGSLLCAIGNAGPPPVWRQWRGGFDLFLFEHCLVAARVTATETWKAFKTPKGLSKPMKPELAQRMRLDAKGSRSISDLLDAHSANRVVPITAVREASLRRGRFLSRLALTLTDGETVEWAWGSPNRPFEDVHRALRQMLGARLTLE
jgi:hypothetical protein